MTDLIGRTAEPRAGRREWAALVVLALAVLLLAIDGTVLSLAVPAMSQALGPSSTQVLWIADAYSFALAGLLVTMGGVGDRVGRKRLLLIGAAGFAAASLLAAFAPSAGWLIAARVLLGVAGATIMPSTLSIIRNMFRDSRQRTTAIAVWGAMAAGGAAIGPLVGGVLLEHFWWGSVFVINLPVMVLLLGLGIRLIPESRDPAPGPFDPVSALLSLVGIVPVVYGVKELAAHGVSIPAVGALAVGVTGLVLFVRRQRTLASPLIDVSLFRRPVFAGAVAANLLSIFALSGMLFFLSQYLQLVRGYGPIEAGLRQAPLTLASVAAIAAVGVLVARAGRGRAISAGLALTAVGLLLLAVTEGRQDYWWLAGALVITGLGVGIALTLTTDAVVSAVPPDRAGAASAVSETAYELGVALGIAVLGSILNAVYRSGIDLPAQLPTQAADAGRESLPTAVGVAEALPAEARDALVAAARDAFVDAMQVTSVLAAVIAAAAAVVAFRVIPSPTDRSHEPRGQS